MKNKIRYSKIVLSIVGIVTILFCFISTILFNNKIHHTVYSQELVYVLHEQDDLAYVTKQRFSGNIYTVTYVYDKKNQSKKILMNESNTTIYIMNNQNKTPTLTITIYSDNSPAKYYVRLNTIQQYNPVILEEI